MNRTVKNSLTRTGIKHYIGVDNIITATRAVVKSLFYCTHLKFNSAMSPGGAFVLLKRETPGTSPCDCVVNSTALFCFQGGAAMQTQATPIPTLTFSQQRKILNRLKSLSEEFVADKKKRRSFISSVKRIIAERFNVQTFKHIPSNRYSELQVYLLEFEPESAPDSKLENSAYHANELNRKLSSIYALAREATENSEHIISALNSLKGAQS